MAQVNRKIRYVLDYVANIGPIRRALAMQQRLNNSVRAGSSAVNSFGRSVRATFSSVSARLSGVTGLAGALGGAFSNAAHRIRNALVTTRFEVATLGAVISGVLTKITVGGVKSVAAAEDIRNQFDVSFSQVYQQATELVSKMKQDLRLNEVTIKGFLSSTQDLLVGFGMTQQAALGLSDQIVRLSLDLASWNNVPFETAMHNMLSGLVGNHEALRSLRIMMTQATLERKKEELGIKASWKSLDEATKVYLRYQVAVQQSVNALGDLQRTAQETNNRFKFFSEQVKTVSLSVFPKFTYWVGAIAEKIGVWILNNEKMFTDLGDYIARLGFHLSRLTDVVTRFMDKWSGLHQTTKELAIFSAGVAGIATPLLGVIVIFGRALTVVSGWLGVLLLVALALQDIYAVMNGGNGYFREFLDYTGASVKDVSNLKDRMLGFGKSFITAARESTALRTALSDTWNLLIVVFGVLLDDFIPALKLFWDTLNTSNVLGTLFKGFLVVLEMVLRMIGLVFAVLTGDTERILEHIRKWRDLVVTLFVVLVKGIATSLWSIVTNIIPKILKGLVGIIMSIIGSALGIITKIIITAFKTIITVGSAALKIIGGLIGGLFKGLWTLGKVIGLVFKHLLTNVISKVFSGIKDGISDVINKIKGITKYMPKWLQKRLNKDSEEDKDKPVGTDADGEPIIPTNGPVIKEPPIIPTTSVVTSTGAVNTIIGQKTKGKPSAVFQFGDIQMPIYLPENFSGNAEEFRKIAASEAEKVFSSSLRAAYDDQVGE